MEKIVTDTALNNLTTLVGTHARGTPQTVRFGSVCSGIEAASVAWGPLGWKAAWFSEIDKFPCAVLNHHYPDVKNFGDMRSLPSRILSGEIEAPDVLCGGTPCQAFSFAGSRQSLKDERGSLSLTFCEIANAVDSVRSGLQQPPAIVLWENVPGALNTGDNAFGCFVAGVAGEDEPLEPPGGRWANAGYVLGPKRAVAWRVLDAQYFGLAQRRRRVFVVASARKDFDPAAVLFEFEGVRRDSPPSRRAQKHGTPNTEESTNPSCVREHDQGFCVDLCQQAGSPDYICKVKDELYRLLGIDSTHSLHKDGICVSVDDVGGYTVSWDIAGTLLAQGSSIKAQTAYTGQLLPVLVTDTYLKVGSNQASTSIPLSSVQVRRLTPLEYERLQGFPDNYTRVPLRGAPAELCFDGPRYTAVGNSWPVPVVRWIGQRIDQLLSGAPQLRVGDLKHPS